MKRLRNITVSCLACIFLLCVGCAKDKSLQPSQNNNPNKDVVDKLEGARQVNLEVQDENGNPWTLAGTVENNIEKISYDLALQGHNSENYHFKGSLVRVTDPNQLISPDDDEPVYEWVDFTIEGGDEDSEFPFGLLEFADMVMSLIED